MKIDQKKDDKKDDKKMNLELTQSNPIEVGIYKNRFSDQCDLKLTTQDVFEMIRSEASDVKKEDRLGVVYATETIKGRRHEHISRFTGLAFIDVDKCTDPKEVKRLFTEISNIYATWYSSSGNVHALVKIPICKNIEEFKLRYQALIDCVRDLIGDLGLVDDVTSNPTQLGFISHDPEIYINERSLVFKDKYKAKNKVIPKPLERYKGNDRSTDWILKKVKEWITGITTNGYPQVLSYSQTLGGWSSAGYIKEDEAEDVLVHWIRQNHYLNSKASSGTLNTYLNASQNAFREGLKRPLYWN